MYKNLSYESSLIFRIIRGIIFSKSQTTEFLLFIRDEKRAKVEQLSGLK